MGPELLKSIKLGLMPPQDRPKKWWMPYKKGLARARKISNSAHKEPARLVNLTRLADFINNVVAKRKFPSSLLLTPDDGPDPKVLMKLDIEGSEVNVVADLLFSGCLQHLDVVMIEWQQTIMEDNDMLKQADMVSRY